MHFNVLPLLRKQAFGLAMLAHAAIPLADASAEEIVYLNEFDHLANRTALFNEGAGVSESRWGCLRLSFNAAQPGEFHRRWFAVETPPREGKWTFGFRFGLGSVAVRSFGVKFYFGDPAKPETRVVRVREDDPVNSEWGFLSPAGWDMDKGAVTVDGGKATLFTMRAGGLQATPAGSFPTDKPLLGWNLVAEEPGTSLFFDRVWIADGVARPWERGDLADVFAASPREQVAAWDAGFGSAVTNGGVMRTASGASALTVRFRAPFRRGDRSVKAVECAFDFLCGTNGAPRLTFGVSPWNAVRTRCSAYRRTAGSPCAAAVEEAVNTNTTLTASFQSPDQRMRWSENLYTLPPMHRYRQPEQNELHRRRDWFVPPSGRTYELGVTPVTGNVWRLTVNGQVLREVALSGPLEAVRFRGGEGAEARWTAAPARPETGPLKWRLPVAEGGFRLERARENSGSNGLEENHYLGRTGFDNMPSSCIFAVPKRQWARVKARVRIDPAAPKAFVPVVTARLTHFVSSGAGGRNPNAIASATVDLSKDDPRVVRKGGDYEVTLDFDVASIMDLTSMTDGFTRTELPCLHVEFMGPTWEKSRYYVDAWRSPAEELRSSAILLAAELEESPVRFSVKSDRPFALYYPGETPKAEVEVAPVASGTYRLTATVEDADGAAVERQTAEFAAAGRRTLAFAAAKTPGFYRVRYAVADAAGRVLQAFDGAAFGLLEPDTREAGYESPYYSWSWSGGHGTCPDFDVWAKSYDFLGVRRMRFGLDRAETNAAMRAHGFTTVQFGSMIPPGDKAMPATVREMRRWTEAFPHCKQALVFHESGFGPWPRELWGGKTELTPGILQQQSNSVASAVRCAKCWREADPSVRLVIGNTGDSLGVVSALMRGGFPREYADSWGEESVGLTEPPEMSTALTPWCIRRLAAMYGYPDRIECPFEWKCRCEKFERSFRGAAAVNMRDALIAHALGYETVPVTLGTEINNSYADTIWCTGVFARWPFAYPREEALSVATITLVLDKAKFRRRLETGSLTCYALEFEGKDGKWIYALWTARGETGMTPAFEKLLGVFARHPEYEVVSMLGARRTTDAAKVDVSDEPCYLVSGTRIASFAADPSRTFRRERPERLARNRPAADLDAAEKVEVVAGEDVRIDPKYDSRPYRPGRFAVRTVTDDEKGPCIEVTHLSQEGCPEIMQEYALLRLREPQTVEGRFDTIGVWAKGNSSWGRVSFELTDAEGEKWYSSGIGGVGCATYDWPAKLAFNYDGWNFLQLPVTPASDERNWGPGDNSWQWTHDASGNGRIDWPVKVTAVGGTQYGRTLDLLEMRKGAPSVRLGRIEVR